jgi:hypothetical protein
MPDVLLSNDDITVLGPPEVVQLLIDIGPTGTRGSQTFVGVGDPNIVSIGQTPILNDLYINTSPGVDYAYLYQYRTQPGGNSWVKILKMNPVLYSKIHSVTFSAGLGVITIPISDIVTSSGTQLEASNFAVQFSMVNSTPAASAMIVPSLVGDKTDLVINIETIEYNSGVWEPLDHITTVHIFISVVI